MKVLIRQLEDIPQIYGYNSAYKDIMRKINSKMLQGEVTSEPSAVALKGWT